MKKIFIMLSIGLLAIQTSAFAGNIPQSDRNLGTFLTHLGLVVGGLIHPQMIVDACLNGFISCKP